MTREVGRPTKLDDHLFRKIKELVLDGLNLREIAETLDISYATMRDWEYENYKGFSDRMLSFKHERILTKAETNIEVLLDSEDERVQADISKFALERLNKKVYSTRVENTGADGSPLVITFDESFKNKNATPNTTSETEGDSIQ
jgi:uncharacterized protein YjcR